MKFGIVVTRAPRTRLPFIGQFVNSGSRGPTVSGRDSLVKSSPLDLLDDLEHVKNVQQLVLNSKFVKWRNK